jgi:small ligand-binding sensory domain FIST
MPFAAALSTRGDTAQAIAEVCQKALEHFSGPADLALIFFSAHHADAADRIVTAAQERLSPRTLLGCSGESVVGNDQEIEQRPAVSVWLGRWNSPVRLTPFHLILEQTPDGYGLMGWPDELASADPGQSVLLLLGDPFSFPTDEFLKEVNERHKGLRVVGGMASAASGPGQNRLLLGDRFLEEGAAGLLIQGPVNVRSVVSQGCRPIGRHMVVTRGRDNVIAELGGKSPLEQLQELWPGLPSRDQELFQRGPHVGRVINEYQGEFHRGDFLVRNVMGLDQESGAMAITDRVRVGQTVQFHVRDADSADTDLHELLQIDLSAHERRPSAALLFTCNGRGSRMFSQPHHDARAIRAEAGEIPLAGFFAAGELGPIRGQNFIHGFTASVVLFED